MRKKYIKAARFWQLVDSVKRRFCDGCINEGMCDWYLSPASKDNYDHCKDVSGRGGHTVKIYKAEDRLQPLLCHKIHSRYLYKLVSLLNRLDKRKLL